MLDTSDYVTEVHWLALWPLNSQRSAQVFVNHWASDSFARLSQAKQGGLPDGVIGAIVNVFLPMQYKWRSPRM